MHRLADVGRQLAERLHHLPRPLGGALDDEALVELHQLGGAGFAQQVVADGNAHGIEPVGVQPQLTNAGSMAMSLWLETNR